MPKYKTYTITRLLGLDQQTVDSQEVTPSQLVNVSFDKIGGYKPLILGFSQDNAGQYALPVNPGEPDYLSVYGYDYQGVVSFIQKEAGGNELTSVAKYDTGTSASADLNREGFHIPGFGVYNNRNQFVGIDLNNNPVVHPAGVFTPPTYFTNAYLTSGQGDDYFITRAFNGGEAVAALILYAARINGGYLIVEASSHVEVFPSGSGYFLSIDVNVPYGAPPPFDLNIFVYAAYSEGITGVFGPYVLWEVIENPTAVARVDIDQRLLSNQQITVPTTEQGGVNLDLVLANARSGTSTFSELHAQSLWFSAKNVTHLDKPDVLCYSEPEYLNVFNPLVNQFQVPFVQSEFITALASVSRNELLIFGENEILVARGNPHLAKTTRLENFSIDSFSLELGNDPGKRPARMNRVVFPIWRGDIYRIAGRQLDNLTEVLNTADDPFIQVVADPILNHLVGVTTSSRRYRYDLAKGQWMQEPGWGIYTQYSGNPFSNAEDLNLAGSTRITSCLPTPGKPGVVYFDYNDSDSTDAKLYAASSPESTISANVADKRGWLVYEIDDVSGGDPYTSKEWVRVRMRIGNIEAFTAPNNPARARLYYQIVDELDSISTSFVDPDIYEHEMVFTFPCGSVSRTATLKLLLYGIDMAELNDLPVIEPAITITYIPRYSNY